MPYPDLPPQPTFWRCPNCANEQEFRASGIGHIRCVKCDKEWTVQQLKEEHARAHAATV